MNLARMRPIGLALSLAIATLGCGQNGFPGAGSGTPSRVSLSVTSDVLTQQTQPFTQAIVTPYSRDCINHLVMKLFTVSPSGEAPVLDGSGQQVQADIPASALSLPWRVSNLAPATTYRIRCYAYDAPGAAAQDKISEDDASYTDVAVGTAPDCSAQANVTLQDRIFSGTGTGTFQFLPGAIVASGAVGINQPVTLLSEVATDALKPGEVDPQAPIAVSYDPVTGESSLITDPSALQSALQCQGLTVGTAAGVGTDASGQVDSILLRIVSPKGTRFARVTMFDSGLAWQNPPTEPAISKEEWSAFVARVLGAGRSTQNLLQGIVFVVFVAAIGYVVIKLFEGLAGLKQRVGQDENSVIQGALRDAQQMGDTATPAPSPTPHPCAPGYDLQCGWEWNGYTCGCY